MKILSIAIPSYNSQDYMRNCIDSLLTGGEEVEILIVDDGSKDATPQIADEYQAKYPGIVKAIHQPNGGHGEAVNAGLRNATGYFYKVVDSDDWVDQDAYKQILDFLREAVKEEEPLDMLISNYVYEKQGAKHKKVIQYHSILPENRYFGWEEIGHFKPSQNILMHSVIYRTEMLRSCGFELPKHTFYVDNIFVYWPLPYVKKMYYLDVDFYRYFIGRDDQSVNEKVMISRIDQQIRVNKIMIDIYAKHESSFSCEQLKDYMQHYLETILLVTSVLLMKMDTEEADEMR
ncbi:MAG: glycosyltransferase family 2 protein, partial [Anaerobutyricum sp.]|nr:glycosyltransferase family 2 protein [Anaerobutyricum sp.]